MGGQYKLAPYCRLAYGNQAHDLTDLHPAA